MKKSISLTALLSVMGVYLLTQSAWADSTGATCEFYKHGDKKHDRWGPCSFSQRQGYIDITLANGSTYNLSPRDDANQFKDQEGNKVDRTQARGDRHVYEWHNDQQKLVVIFDESSSSSGSSATPSAASDGGIAVSDMARYCAGEASAAFQQRPTNISTTPAIEDQGMYSVFGQYPPSGADPTVFICTFSGDGKFVSVDKQ